MPKLTQAIPKYRKHRASGQAVVTLSGVDYYLGPHGTKASKLEYDRVVGEWLAQGRAPLLGADDSLTVVELVARYFQHAKEYYECKPGHGELWGIQAALKLVKDYYGRTMAA